MVKKKSGGLFVPVLAFVVIAGGIVFAVGQNWQTGENAVVNLARAQLGDAESLYQQGVKARDDAAAIPLFEKAAKQGHVKAMLALGDIYNKSKAEADGDAAVRWYKDAANAGNIEAGRKLAIAVGVGRGSAEPDIIAADKLMKQAAEAGDGPAQLILGRNLASGGYTDEGEKWLLKAAAQQVPGSSAALGNLYYNAQSPLKDDAKAHDWYAKAAEEGDMQSQLNFSYMYYSGRGVKKDDAEAWKWLAIADSSEYKVRSARAFLKNEIKPEAIAEGDRRAAEWKAAHKS